ncbi:MAG: SAM-dependent chlorinase/fluorinase [Lachnospiraceae bacterium]|nr:SAM-dependent chlorinase/fluorinase [Lachnospiraceae bacterium]
MKPVILLQTDFSLTWGAVAAVKGVIKQVDPNLEIQDLCHDIKKFDPWEASLSLESVVSYWPEGTVVVSVVDPGVGTDRKACVAELKNGTYVITPDNGTLTHLKHSIGIRSVRELDPSIRYNKGEEVSVFHGRDIFGYAAALLASGQKTFEQMGPEYPAGEIRECEEYDLQPALGELSASGFIMTGLKHFGGVQFNITNEEWKKCGFSEGESVHVTISHGGKTVFDTDVRYERSFGYVPEGEPVLYCGSSRHLSLDLNCDNFMEKYGIDTGRDWTVTFQKR